MTSKTLDQLECELNKKLDKKFIELEDRIRRLDDKMEIYFIKKGDANARNKL